MARRNSITTMYGRANARGGAAMLRLTQAYRAVFSGSPGPDDQSIVLADLAAKSGFYCVTPHEMSADALRHNEGMRSLFSHIFRHLSLAPEDIASLENAARIESAADNI